MLFLSAVNNINALLNTNKIIRVKNRKIGKKYICPEDPVWSISVKYAFTPTCILFSIYCILKIAHWFFFVLTCTFYKYEFNLWKIDNAAILFKDITQKK